MALLAHLCRAAAARPPLAAAWPALLRPSGAGAQQRRGMAMGAFAASIQADAAWVQKIAAGGVGDGDAAGTFVDAIMGCTGRVLVTGIGKSGCVGRRMSVSLMSTGTLAHFVHAAEWVHGDLGCVTPEDVVICISHSGNTQELVHAMSHIQARNPTPTILTIQGAADEAGTPRDSKLALCSKAVLSYPVDTGKPEPVGGAPTSSVVGQVRVFHPNVSSQPHENSRRII
jgi:D-arabinose 5-phosphate isomerase GutQ